jgi:cell division protease FtsH
MYTRSQLKERLAMMLSGHAAEDLVFHERTTGAHDDIKQATTLARRMVVDFGMSEKLGTRTFGDKQEMVFLGREISEQKDYSERFALEIDREVDIIIAEGYNTAKRTLEDNFERLVQVAQELLERETLSGDDVEALFSAPVSPEVEAKVEELRGKAPGSTRRRKPRARKAAVGPGVVLSKQVTPPEADAR